MSLNYLKVFLDLLEHPDRFYEEDSLSKNGFSSSIVNPEFIYSNIRDVRPIIGEVKKGIFELPRELGALELDLPFKCCWFQKKEDEHKFNALAPYYLEGSTDKFISCMGAFVYEIHPKDFIVHALIYLGTYKDNTMITQHKKILAFSYKNEPIISDNIGLIEACILVIKSELKELQDKGYYYTNDSEKIKIRNGKNRKKYKINKVIYISNKPKAINKRSNENVVYSHRFEVMGHWRKLKTPYSKGKDRAGNEQLGWTWIKPFIKGKKDLPLIKKIRVISR